ncbi:Adenosine kinase 2 [Glycine soja]|uniref:Adenosine kinase n=1 Tax=Glycine soja TaxID=3848 RepID=A0A445H3S9_GLYSO|nr:Adenosine kinase 2 [Glycine soja]
MTKLPPPPNNIAAPPPPCCTNSTTALASSRHITSFQNHLLHPSSTMTKLPPPPNNIAAPPPLCHTNSLGMEEVVEVWINFFGSPTIDLHDEPFCYLYLYMDYIFGNETEARTFSKAQGWEISHLPKASQKHKRITVITQGADPVSVAEDEKIKLYPMILLPKDKLVDTNGAGDAFVGGLLSQLVKQKPIK